MVIEEVSDQMAIIAGIILVFAVIGFISFLRFFFNLMKRVFKSKKATEDTLKPEFEPSQQRPQQYYSPNHTHTLPPDWEEPTKPQRQIRSFVDPID